MIKKASPDLKQKIVVKSRSAKNILIHFARSNWKGFAVIAFAITIFFWPLIIHASTYSVGGDSMFNSWTLARDQHCILRQQCPSYIDGNIFFPHKNTMLYSETQLSAGLLTLPLYFINQSPLFSNNLWTVISFFLMGFFMYLLAKRLSKDRELISIVAGLVFALAPFQMSAVWHLQNLAIFYLPLAALLIIRYFDTKRRGYLVGLLITLTLLNYASLYQMIFGLSAIVIMVCVLALTRVVRIKSAVNTLIIVLLSLVMFSPLALQYAKFSSQTGASFGVNAQTAFSSSLEDYLIPNNGTIVGKIYYKLKPEAQVDAYNLDSYSYHSLTLYAVASFVIFMAYKARKKRGVERYNSRLVLALALVGLVGFFASLGPLLKLGGSYTYGAANGIHIAVIAPYALVDAILPQLHFIRAVGRWSVLVLFSLCCLLALFPRYLRLTKLSERHIRLTIALVVVALFLELTPVHFATPSGLAYTHSFTVPKVYTYIKNNKHIDDILVIDGDSDYPNVGIPVAGPEWVLWAGYDNKNTFNGYSGYMPPDFMPQYTQFRDNLEGSSVVAMRKLGIKYVLIDKQLSRSRPQLIESAQHIFASHRVYTDARFDLYKV